MCHISHFHEKVDIIIKLGEKEKATIDHYKIFK